MTETVVEGGLPIAEAAKALNLSPAALRKRVHRKSVPAYKGEDGNWYVLVDQVELEASEPEQEPELTPPPPAPSVVYDQYIADLREEVSFLRSELEVRNEELAQRSEELRRRDIMLMKFTEKPVLELSESIAARDNGYRHSETQPAVELPWWKKLLGLQ
jgi:hypothetical protein